MDWTGKVQSVAFSIFGRDIAWYGIIITCSMLVGLVLAVKMAKKVKLTSDDLIEVFLFAIPFAVLFARLGYVIVRYETYFPANFDWSNFVEVFAVWDGGLTIMTGGLGGVFGAWIWSKWRRVDLISLLDAIMYVVLLCQAIGRWGNFFNQEIYGAPITNPAAQWFPLAVYIRREGGFFMATFFYEMCFNILGFIAMIFVSKRLAVRGKGLLMYIATYGFIRFVMEFMRDDGDVYEVVNFNQIICIVVCLLAVGTLVWLAMRKKKNGGRVWYKNGIPAHFIKPARYDKPAKTPEKIKQGGLK